VAKLYTNPSMTRTEAEGSGATPVQFLPSAMLAWRTPIMARAGLPAKIVLKTFDDQITVRQNVLFQPAR
jgi:hypothetical protein